jgi:hypothetical protein
MKGLTNLPQKLPRHSPAVGRIAAEKRLFNELDKIAPNLASTENFGRAVMIESMKSICIFLHDRGLSGQALKPFIDILKALGDVEKGVLPPVFDPKAAMKFEAQKWSRSSAAAETKVFAAALMDALIRKKMKKSEAAKLVARFAKNWPRISIGVITHTTVANWRDELGQRMSTDADRMSFERYSRNFVTGPRAPAYLKEALRSGPPLTGGRRNPKT